MTTPPHPRRLYLHRDPHWPATGKTLTSHLLLAHVEKAKQERRERLLRDLNAVATKAMTASPAPLPRVTITDSGTTIPRRWLA